VDLAGGFVRRARQQAKKRRGSGWEKEVGVFLGPSPNMGFVVGKNDRPPRPAGPPTPQHRCGEWVKGSTITLQRRDRERDARAIRKVIKIGSNAAGGVIELGGVCIWLSGTTMILSISPPSGKTRRVHGRGDKAEKENKMRERQP
jgi:hypothetical protein